MRKKSLNKSGLAKKWDALRADARKKYTEFRNKFAPDLPSWAKSDAYIDLVRRKKRALYAYDYRKRNKSKISARKKAAKKVRENRGVSLTQYVNEAFNRQGRQFDDNVRLSIVKHKAEFNGIVSYKDSARVFTDYGGFMKRVSEVIAKIMGRGRDYDSTEITKWLVSRFATLTDGKKTVVAEYSFFKDGGEAESDKENEGD